MCPYSWKNKFWKFEILKMYLICLLYFLASKYFKNVKWFIETIRTNNLATFLCTLILIQKSPPTLLNISNVWQWRSNVFQLCPDFKTFSGLIRMSIQNLSSLVVFLIWFPKKIFWTSLECPYTFLRPCLGFFFKRAWAVV